MKASGVVRFFYTVRALRVEQIAYRLYYRFGRFYVFKQALQRLPCITLRPWKSLWDAPSYFSRSLLGKGDFSLLNESGLVRTPKDWNSPSKTKLWLYNLHYFDDLNAEGAESRAELHSWLIQSWIDENPPLKGNGWEPYPLALRTVNLIKCFVRRGNIKHEWVSSLARQVQALYVQEERHLLANHLFVDGKALVFAGAFFAGKLGDRWLARGLKILDEEIVEQFLPDGGNFELSPMYHASLLWDLCDLVRLGEVSGIRELEVRSESWRGAIRRGLEWLNTMCHPDKEIAFFNDAAFGIAPTLAQLQEYGSLLGIASPCDSGYRSLRYLADTGYVVVSWGDGAKVLFDVAAVGPAYQPGHAHADTLSIELSVFGQRVLVNSGTSQYGEDVERQRQRGTRAHNTVMLNGVDSSEVWAGFRVARRANPFGLILDSDGVCSSVACSHDGYRRLPGEPVHRRELTCSPGRLLVTDFVIGTYEHAVSRFHLHPDVRVISDGTLMLKGGELIHFTISGGGWEVLATTWHPGFGSSIPNVCIEISLAGSEASIEFLWG